MPSLSRQCNNPRSVEMRCIAASITNQESVSVAPDISVRCLGIDTTSVYQWICHNTLYLFIIYVILWCVPLTYSLLRNLSTNTDPYCIQRLITSECSFEAWWWLKLWSKHVAILINKSNCTLTKGCVDDYNFNNLIFYTQQDAIYKMQYFTFLEGTINR
jgi:hypothetical protein